MKRIVQLLLLAAILFVPAVSLAVHDDFLPTLLRETAGTQDRLSAIRLKDRWFALGRESGHLDIWDVDRPKFRRTIKAHASRVSELAFGRNGAIIISNAQFEGDTKVWLVKTGELLVSIPDARGPVFETWRKNIYLIANGSEVWLFDLAKKKPLIEKYRIEGDVTAVAGDKASGLIVMGTASGAMETWQLLDGEAGAPVMKKLAGKVPYMEGNWIIGIHFSKTRGSFFSVARNGNVAEWKADTLQEIRTIPIKLAMIYSSAFLPGPELLALGGSVNAAGYGGGYVEIKPLVSSDSVMHKAIGNISFVEFFPSKSSVLVAHSFAMGMYAYRTD